MGKGLDKGATQLHIEALCRGRALDEEPRVQHNCSLGVGCEEAGVCYAESQGEPDRCGKPEAGAGTADRDKVVALIWGRYFQPVTPASHIGNVQEALRLLFDAGYLKLVTGCTLCGSNDHSTTGCPMRGHDEAFQREERYLVIKYSDLIKVSPEYRLPFMEYLDDIKAEIPHRECLVIESDWPEYEPAWRMIEARVTGAAPSAPKADDPVKVQLLEALEAAEKKLCIAEYHLDKGEDDSVVFESEILLARAAIAAARQEGGKV